MPMRVLVTGAGGFAGGHIARRLAEAGFVVVAATRRSPVAAPVAPAAARRFATIHAALDGADALPREIDAVVHAAATSPWGDTRTDRIVSDNVAATQAVIRHALAVGARAFVFLSSMSAFGRVATARLSEKTPSVAVDAYGATKLLGEQLLADVAADLPSLSIRLPAVVGRGSRRNWPSESLRKLAAGAPLGAFNRAAPYNNLVHEADLAALVAAVLGGSLAGAEMIVVGSAGRITIGEAMQIMVDGSGSRSTVSWTEQDRPAFLIDFAKAARLFRFAPMRVDDALRRFVADNRD